MTAIHRFAEIARKDLSILTSAILCAAIVSCGGGGDGAEQTPDLGAATGVDANSAPQIQSISMGCDLVLESVGLELGDVANFTLLVDDESPLTLQFFISSDNPEISTASVSADGVFTLTGLADGQTTMPIVVTDENGLSDQLLLSVIVGG